MSTDRMKQGNPHLLGAHVDGEGANFALFSANATRVTLCFFDPQSGKETRQIDLPHREGDVWFGYLPGIEIGQYYGYRVHGPYDPANGHRFNPNKLLVDPYARQLTGHPLWDPALLGFDVDLDGSNDFVFSCVRLP